MDIGMAAPDFHRYVIDAVSIRHNSLHRTADLSADTGRARVTDPTSSPKVPDQEPS